MNGTVYNINFNSELLLYDYTANYNSAQNGQLTIKTGTISNSSGSWEDNTTYAKADNSGIYLAWNQQQAQYIVVRWVGMAGISGIDFTNYKALHALVYSTNSLRGITLGYKKKSSFEETPSFSTSCHGQSIDMDGYTVLQHTSGSSNFPSGADTEVVLDITSVTGEQCVEIVGASIYIHKIWLT